jgi:Glycosyltransferase family 87
MGSVLPRDPASSIPCKIVILAGALLGAMLYGSIWQIAPDGRSVITGGTVYWDFSNLWFGSRLVLDGQAASLFDPDLYRSALRHTFFQSMANQEWSYPPSMVLIGAPLALMPIGLAYGLWTLGTIALLWAALRTLAIPNGGRLAILISPAVFINAALGQNGALTAALFLAGLTLLEKRPLLSGVLIGLLTIKPHLGILLPVILLASRHYRAFASATVTALALVLLTALLWGQGIWVGFWEKTMPLMSSIMQAPFPQPYHSKALTIFVMARSWGLSLTSAYALQALSLLAAIVVTWRVWRPAANADGHIRVAMTALLLLLSTPYGYIYDSIPVTVAAMLLINKRGLLPTWLFALLWLLPIIAIYLNGIGLQLSILIPAFAVLWILLKSHRAHHIITS